MTSTVYLSPDGIARRPGGARAAHARRAARRRRADRRGSRARRPARERRVRNRPQGAVDPRGADPAPDGAPARRRHDRGLVDEPRQPGHDRHGAGRPRRGDLHDRRQPRGVTGHRADQQHLARRPGAPGPARRRHRDRRGARRLVRPADRLAGLTGEPAPGPAAAKRPPGGSEAPTWRQRSAHLASPSTPPPRWGAYSRERGEARELSALTSAASSCGRLDRRAGPMASPTLRRRARTCPGGVSCR